jgi:hypothetical protein
MLPRFPGVSKPPKSARGASNKILQRILLAEQGLKDTGQIFWPLQIMPFSPEGFQTIKVL